MSMITVAFPLLLTYIQQRPVDRVHVKTPKYVLWGLHLVMTFCLKYYLQSYFLAALFFVVAMLWPILWPKVIVAADYITICYYRLRAKWYGPRRLLTEAEYIEERDYFLVNELHNLRHVFVNETCFCPLTVDKFSDPEKINRFMISAFDVSDVEICDYKAYAESGYTIMPWDQPAAGQSSFSL